MVGYSFGGNHHGATFIPTGDDLKQKFCPLLVHREIAQLINDKQPGAVKDFMVRGKELSAREADN